MRDLIYEKTADDLSLDQMVVLVKILSQNADMAGAQLTAIVPYSSITLCRYIRNMPTACSTRKTYVTISSRVAFQVESTSLKINTLSQSDTTLMTTRL